MVPETSSEKDSPRISSRVRAERPASLWLEGRTALMGSRRRKIRLLLSGRRVCTEVRDNAGSGSFGEGGCCVICRRMPGSFSWIRRTMAGRSMEAEPT